MGILKRRSKVSAVNTNDIHMLTYDDFPSSLFEQGYTRLIDNAEFKAGINKIADLVSNMTITLMENQSNGPKRIENNLSRKLDIEPNIYMSRKDFMFNITSALLTLGNQIVLPRYRKGELYNLDIVPDEDVTYYTRKYSYEIKIEGKDYAHNEVLHFRLNPSPDCPFVGTGYQVQLKDILNNLKLASATKKAFMGRKYMPPVIIGVDSNSEKMKSKKGRDGILESYIETEQGKPWIIPSTSMEVKQVKPLTLKDIAINESVEIDKKTVAVVLGMPAFLLGVGEYNENEYNNFISTKIMSIVEIFQQEKTRKLIMDSKQYVRFNIKSLYRYSIETMAKVGRELRAIGVVDGNEVRRWVGEDPREGLDELVMLENFIPNDKLGDQKKLKGGE